MPYPVELTEPMRQELTRLGVRDLRTPEEVDQVLQQSKGSVLLFVNSVCGCAAGSARPGLAEVMASGRRPDVIASVFAGVDVEATARARTYFKGYPPSSPQIALFRDGELVHLIQRHQIEGRTAEEVADSLRKTFDKHIAQIS